MKIILKKKHGEHNYKQKYDMKTRHCPDLNQGSLSSKREIPGSKPGRASFSNHTFVCNYVLPGLFVKMISIHCLRSHVVLWLSGKCACLVNRRSLVQIRAVPHFQIVLWFVIMFIRFICQNYFHLLSTTSRGAVA